MFVHRDVHRHLGRGGAEAQLRDANAQLEERQKEIDEDLARSGARAAAKPRAAISSCGAACVFETYPHSRADDRGRFGLVSPHDARSI